MENMLRRSDLERDKIGECFRVRPSNILYSLFLWKKNPLANEVDNGSLKVIREPCCNHEGKCIAGSGVPVADDGDSVTGIVVSLLGGSMMLFSASSTVTLSPVIVSMVCFCEIVVVGDSVGVGGLSDGILERVGTRVAILSPALISIVVLELLEIGTLRGEAVDERFRGVVLTLPTEVVRVKVVG